MGRCIFAKLVSNSSEKAVFADDWLKHYYKYISVNILKVQPKKSTLEYVVRVAYFHQPHVSYFIAIVKLQFNKQFKNNKHQPLSRPSVNKCTVIILAE